MKTALFTTLGISSLLFLLYLFNTYEKPLEERLEAARTTDILNLQAIFPSSETAEGVAISRGSIEEVVVSGEFYGASPEEFALLARANLMFEVGILKGNEIIWSTNPGKIEIDDKDDSKFHFNSRFMLSKRVQPGRHEFRCYFDRKQIYSKPIFVQ